MEVQPVPQLLFGFCSFLSLDFQGTVGSKTMPVFPHSEKARSAGKTLGFGLAENSARSQAAWLALGLYCLLKDLGQMM